MINFISSDAPIIKLNRGDTLITPIPINHGTKLCPIKYHLQDDDKLYFGLMEPNRLFEQSILKKTFDKYSKTTPFGDILLELRPEDTQFLMPGMYYYMIKLRRIDENAHEYVSTIIPKTLFYIL